VIFWGSAGFSNNSQLENHKCIRFFPSVWPGEYGFSFEFAIFLQIFAFLVMALIHTQLGWTMYTYVRMLFFFFRFTLLLWTCKKGKNQQLSFSKHSKITLFHEIGEDFSLWFPIYTQINSLTMLLFI
jgi:hypothetical protein